MGFSVLVRLSRADSRASTSNHEYAHRPRRKQRTVSDAVLSWFEDVLNVDIPWHLRCRTIGCAIC
jgi:hypothetical protein